MEGMITENSLLSLFLLSFLAATIVPIGSEWLLIALLLKGFDFKQVVMIATIGNFLGACTTYYIGILGASFFINKVLQISPRRLEQAKSLYKKFGSWSLFFSWLPLIGDPICLLGGILRIHFSIFSLLVFSGKLLRYAVVAYLTSATASL